MPRAFVIRYGTIVYAKPNPYDCQEPGTMWASSPTDRRQRNQTFHVAPPPRPNANWARVKGFDGARRDGE